MITKQEFEEAAERVRSNFIAAFPKMMSYKNCIQHEVLNIVTQQEIDDVRDCRINQNMISKLAKLAKKEWQLSGDAQSLYCAAMVVATIIKECDWGIEYLSGDGLWNMALKIQNS